MHQSAAGVSGNRDKSGRFQKHGKDGKREKNTKGDRVDADADSEDDSDDSDDSDDDEPDDDEDDDSDDDADAAEHVASVSYSDAQKAWDEGDIAAVAKALGKDPSKIKIDGKAFRAIQREQKKLQDLKDSQAADHAKHEKDLGEERKLLDRGYAELNPIVRAMNAHAQGNKKAAVQAIQLMFKKSFAEIAREYYDDFKTPAAVTAMERENTELRARVEKLEGKGKAGDQEQQQAPADDREARAKMAKAFAKHPLAKLEDRDDDSLQQRAFKVWHKSWDADLQTHSLTRKQALDQVLQKEQKRAERLSKGGKSSSGKGERREQEAPEQKAYKDMTKEERRAYDTRQAIAASESSKADRRQRS